MIIEHVLFSDSAAVWRNQGAYMDTCYVLCRRLEGSARDGVFVEMWRDNSDLGIVDYQIIRLDALEDSIPVDAAAIRKAISLFNGYLVANGGKEIP